MESIVVGNPSLQVGHGHVDVALDGDSAIIAFLHQLWRNAVEPVIQLVWLRKVGRRSNRLALKFHRKLFSLAVGRCFSTAPPRAM